MSNPKDQHAGTAPGGGRNTAARADPLMEAGTEASRPKTETAGETNRLPQQLSSDHVLALLVSALEQLGSDRPHLAAGVGAKMRQLDHGFSQRVSGFPSFRDLLRTAQRQGLISLDDTATPNDLAVTLGGGQVAAGRDGKSRRVTKLRADVWKAFLNWDPNVVHAFDRSLKRPYLVVEAIPSGDVEIPFVDKRLHAEWMTAFATEESDTRTLDALAQVASDPERINVFSTHMRDDAEAARKWKRFLRRRVLDRATDWAHANGIDPADLELAPEERQPILSVEVRRVEDGERDADLRAQILAILATLPTSDLMRLPIPVELALRR